MAFGPEEIDPGAYNEWARPRQWAAEHPEENDRRMKEARAKEGAGK
jgi:hypothetical protein